MEPDVERYVISQELSERLKRDFTYHPPFGDQPHMVHGIGMDEAQEAKFDDIKERIFDIERKAYGEIHVPEKQRQVWNKKSKKSLYKNSRSGPNDFSKGQFT
jgi:hypothetical protein